jgi:hypothetical protein
MAIYQETSNLTYSGSALFTQSFEPGQPAPYGGIYKCTGCGLEIGIAKHHTLPSQNHHQHRTQYLPIRWRAVVIHN